MSEARTIQAALKLGRRQLKPTSDTPYLDAQVLLASLLDQTKAWILSHPEYSFPEELQVEYKESLKRMCAGEPLPYVLGYWEFYGRRFNLTPSVLIPRPETERIIEQGLAFIDRLARPLLAVDVGTGSGCIAITLAAERPNIQMVATDRSRAALKIAKENASLNDVAEQINWLQGDLLGAISARFDLVVANLPYIPSTRLEHLSVAAHEPWVALDGGTRGVVINKALIMQLPDRLAENGLALLEIDDSHGNDMTVYAKDLFPMADVTLESDLAGLDRYLSVNMRG